LQLLWLTFTTEDRPINDFNLTVTWIKENDCLGTKVCSDEDESTMKHNPVPFAAHKDKVWLENSV
jgi:hypothetical protein